MQRKVGTICGPWTM